MDGAGLKKRIQTREVEVASFSIEMERHFKDREDIGVSNSLSYYVIDDATNENDEDAEEYIYTIVGLVYEVDLVDSDEKTIGRIKHKSEVWLRVQKEGVDKEWFMKNAVNDGLNTLVVSARISVRTALVALGFRLDIKFPLISAHQILESKSE